MLLKQSPLLVGVGDNFNVVASDAMAMLQVTDRFIELMDKEIVIVTKESITIKNLQGETIERAPFTAELDASDIEKEHILISCLKKSMSNHL